MNHASQSVDLVRWIMGIVTILAAAAMWEASLGHYRSGFAVRAQYLPIGVAPVLVAAGLVGLAAPTSAGVILQIAGWLGLATGVIGIGYHHYYGIVDKPAGYRWLLHHVLLHAPPLAPLVLTALGALALIAASLASGHTRVLGVAVNTAIIVVSAATLLGAAAQSAILHYRGAFNNVLMYIPVTIPLAAVAAMAWYGVTPSGLALRVASVALWLTFLSGFVGFGMHLRGIDRRMGGLYIARQNLMQGPPVSAPLTFAGFAAVALATLYLR